MRSLSISVAYTSSDSASHKLYLSGQIIVSMMQRFLPWHYTHILQHENLHSICTVLASISISGACVCVLRVAMKLKNRWEHLKMCVSVEPVFHGQKRMTVFVHQTPAGHALGPQQLRIIRACDILASICCFLKY